MAEHTAATTEQQRPIPSGWMKRVRLFGINIYFSNVRLKRRPRRDLCTSSMQVQILQKNKDKLYERQGGKCDACGISLPKEQLELHHILPVSRFPELKLSIRNGVMLCRHCHNEIHINPWLNSMRQEKKAEELGIDLKSRYDYERYICR